jgi:hypothetical protein
MAGCKGAAAHRKAQAKYVSANKSKHAAAVKRNYAKNKGKILAAKKRGAAGGARRAGGTKGRPRKC